jgi:hypothetical protein
MIPSKAVLMRYYHINTDSLQIHIGDLMQNHGHIGKMIHGAHPRAPLRTSTKVQFTRVPTSYVVGIV